jgi:translation elongation factor EF-Tu-like GTPase
MFLAAPFQCRPSLNEDLMRTRTGGNTPTDGLLECFGAGGGDGPGAQAEGVEAIIEELVRLVPAEPRPAKGPFLFSVDHCFALRGQGTVLTGTVLSGMLQVQNPFSSLCAGVREESSSELCMWVKAPTQA